MCDENGGFKPLGLEGVTFLLFCFLESPPGHFTVNGKGGISNASNKPGSKHLPVGLMLGSLFAEHISRKEVHSPIAEQELPSHVIAVDVSGWVCVADRPSGHIHMEPLMIQIGITSVE